MKKPNFNFMLQAPQFMNLPYVAVVSMEAKPGDPVIQVRKSHDICIVKMYSIYIYTCLLQLFTENSQKVKKKPNKLALLKHYSIWWQTPCMYIWFFEYFRHEISNGIF